MTTLHEKFPKEHINEMPLAYFAGRIITIISKREADKAVDYLLRQDILGFDTETRPTFKRGQCHQVALLQVATPDTAFLFRLNKTGITDSIVWLLEDQRITKVGLSLHDDFLQLHKRRMFNTGAFIDIQDEAKDIGIADMSMQKLYANIFHRKISKGQQLTNWEADVLTVSQQRYAATDAWACIMLHQEIQRLKQSGDYRIIRDIQTEHT